MINKALPLPLLAMLLAAALREALLLLMMLLAVGAAAAPAAASWVSLDMIASSWSGLLMSFSSCAGARAAWWADSMPCKGGRRLNTQVYMLQHDLCERVLLQELEPALVPPTEV
jgi:hypothetical protein